MARSSTESEIALADAGEFASKSGDASRQTILVVEDEDFVRNVTCQVLLFAGYEVLSARNAAEAEKCFAKSPKVALLLSDVVLPGRTGRELARDLRALQPALRVLLISGYPPGRLNRLPVQEKGVLYLEKPFSAETLIRKVRHALHKPLAARSENGKTKAARGN